ncbi:MAG: hypothetical protein C4586_08775 [Anaerolineaceae bacterium]|nr:MAG: hypothetical protein C4586_08775 [Anaerolineaceae bacterium]
MEFDDESKQLWEDFRKVPEKYHSNKLLEIKKIQGMLGPAKIEVFSGKPPEEVNDGDDRFWGKSMPEMPDFIRERLEQIIEEETEGENL